MGLLKALVIVTGSLTISWGFMNLLNQELNFPLVERTNRFLPDGPNGVFDDALDELPDITQRRQFQNTLYVDALVWTINFGMGIATLTAGILETKALAYVTGVWMLLFALLQIAIVSSFQSVSCPEDLGSIDPTNPGCSLVDNIRFFVGSQVILAFLIIFYAIMGIVTVLFARDCSDSAPSYGAGSKPTTQMERVA